MILICPIWRPKREIYFQRALPAICMQIYVWTAMLTEKHQLVISGLNDDKVDAITQSVHIVQLSLMSKARFSSQSKQSLVGRRNYFPTWNYAPLQSQLRLIISVYIADWASTLSDAREASFGFHPWVGADLIFVFTRESIFLGWYGHWHKKRSLCLLGCQIDAGSIYCTAYARVSGTNKSMAHGRWEIETHIKRSTAALVSSKCPHFSLTAMLKLRLLIELSHFIMRLKLRSLMDCSKQQYNEQN